MLIDLTCFAQHANLLRKVLQARRESLRDFNRRCVVRQWSWVKAFADHWVTHHNVLETIGNLALVRADVEHHLKHFCAQLRHASNLVSDISKRRFRRRLRQTSLVALLGTATSRVKVGGGDSKHLCHWWRQRTSRKMLWIDCHFAHPLQGGTWRQWSQQLTEATYCYGLASKVNGTCMRLRHAMRPGPLETTLSINGRRKQRWTLTP